jgi:hypothetical protein
MSEASLTKSSIVVAAEHQTSAEVDGESVILDLEEGVYYGLNPVGARIWAEIQEPASVEEIAAAITAEYDVDTEQCLEDVLALLRNLEENDLIEVEG